MAARLTPVRGTAVRATAVYPMVARPMVARPMGGRPMGGRPMAGRTARCLTAITGQDASTDCRTAAGFQAARTASTPARQARRARLGADITALPRRRPPRTLSTATGDGCRRLRAHRHRVLRLQGTRSQAVLRVVRKDTELQEPRESKDRMEDPARMRPRGVMEDLVGHPDRTEYLALREPQDRTQVPDRMQQAALRAPRGRTRLWAPQEPQERREARERPEPMAPDRSEGPDHTEPQEPVASQDRMVPQGPTRPRDRRAPQDHT